jgi:hypothetical protein
MTFLEYSPTVNLPQTAAATYASPAAFLPRDQRTASGLETKSE